jgi:hypothetical protein
MVRDNGQVGDGLGEGRQLGELGEVQRILETQPPTCQYPRAGPKVVAGQLTLKPSVFHLWVRVPSSQNDGSLETGWDSLPAMRPAPAQHAPRGSD